jgi:hypothetical protein
VNAPGGRVANYRTYSIGPVATSLDGGKIALAGTNGAVEHTARDFGLFANVSLGYMFGK